MRFTLVAVAAGLLIGVVAGGRPRHMGDRTLRLFPLLVSGVVLQAIGSRTGSTTGLTALLLSYLLLLGFAVGNASLVGMWLVTLGIALNLLVIGVNAGMPVRPSALVAAGISQPGEVYDVGTGAKRHLERPTDRLTAIADTYPVRPLAEVLSFGDIALNVGVANVLVHLMRPVRSRGAFRPMASEGAGHPPGREDGARGNHRRAPLLQAWLPRRGVPGGGEVGLGPGGVGVRGTHRRR